MSRLFNGSDQAFTLAKAYLSASSGPFTISCWLKPTALSGSVKGIMNSGASGDSWQLDYTGSTNTVSFFADNYTGTNPQTGSSIVLGSNVATDGAWIGYRYTGAGGEWSKWEDGVGTVINAAITFTLPTQLNSFEVGRILSNFYIGATIAEIAIWTTALTDDQMAELAEGVAADMLGAGGLVAYFPLRGNSSPELNYAQPLDVLVPVNAPTLATHPTIVPPRYAWLSSPAWVVDMLHTDGTIRAASTDLYTEIDTDILGDAYMARLADDVRLIEALPDVESGVMIPSDTVVTYRNEDDTFSALTEYRQTPVKIRYYDRISHALTTEFTGVVANNPQIANNLAVFPFSSMVEAELSTLVPRQVIEPVGASGIIDDIDGTEMRHEVGAPIPKVWGSAAISLPPYIGSSGTAQSGQNLVVGMGTAIVLERAWGDKANTPGIELLSLWGTVDPGPPTYLSSTTFAVSGVNMSSLFEAGMPVQRIYSGGTAYSTIASTNFTGGVGVGGTVTLRHAILGTPLGTVSLAGDYIVEHDRYKYVGAGGTTFLTTMRMPAQIDSAIIVRSSDTYYGNPVTAMSYVLTDPDLGLGGSIVTANWIAGAVTALNAGLGAAVSGVLGGDKAQRRAIDVLDELAIMRGIRIWKDADTNAWDIAVDSIPADPVATLSYGVDTPGNVHAIRSITTTPLDEAVSVLKLKYGKGWRDRGVKPIEEAEYDYTATMTVLAVGSERVITSPWIRDHNVAARVLYYIGKRLQREDRKVVLEMGNEARRLALGDVVTLDLQINPSTHLTGTHRIIQRERTLTGFLLTCAGYNADIFETDLADILLEVNQPAGDINPDERGTNPGNDANLILNSDWTAGLNKSTWEPFFDDALMPGWLVLDGLDAVNKTGITVTTSPFTRGGAYITLTVVPTPLRNLRLATYDSSSDRSATIPVQGSTNYILSIYASRADAWSVVIAWYDNASGLLSEVTPTRRVNPGDVNGFGWARYYMVVTAPAGATFASLVFYTDVADYAYSFDAIQFEQVTRVTLRPSPWKRNTQFGISPNRVTPGDFTVRSAGKLEQGTKLSAGGTALVALSGASTVTLGTAAAGMVTGVTGRVVAAITGVSNWRLAFNHGGGTVTNIGTALSVSTGSFNTDTMTSRSIAFPFTLKTATPIVAIGTASFTAGTVAVSAHQIQHVAREA